MAPKKGKNQAKRNNIKIKSKTNPQKRGLKRVKSRKLEEKPLDSLKWYNPTQGEGNLQRIDTGRDWVNGNPYKKDFASSTSSEADSSGYMDYAKKGGAELRSCFTDISDECNCNCNYEKLPESKFGILKRKSSSTNSVVAKYIKSGMDHVASFIVESAIRFGEQHGVVVPDKNTPNVYEITPPHDKRFFDDKCRKIRFKIPKKGLGYEAAKKLMWRKVRNHPDPLRTSLKKKDFETRSHGGNESLQEIIPLLEKLKKTGEPSEVEFKKSESSSEREQISMQGPAERERKRVREKEKGRERDMERSRVREMEVGFGRERGMDLERERGRARQKARERIKKRIRALGRFKSVGAESEENVLENEYSRRPWKPIRQDSLELGRQRLRASTCPRKSDESSETPNY